MGVLIPLMPFYLTALGGQDTTAPYLFAMFSLSAFISTPFWGRLSDKIGRKPVLMISLAGTMIAYFWLAFANSVPELFGARILAGLTAGWMVAAHSTIADITSQNQRAKGMGMLGAAFGIGFTLGPGTGGLMMDKGPVVPLPEDFRLPALLSLVLAGAAFLILLIFLKEPSRKIEPAPPTKENFLQIWIPLEVFRLDGITPLLRLYFLVFLVFTAVEGVFAIWAAARLSLGPGQVGYILAYGGMITILVQGGLIGRLASQCGEKWLVIAALAFLSSALFLLAIADNTPILIVAMTLLALAMSLHNPSMQSLLSQQAPEEKRGLVMGAAQSTMSLARVIGPVWGAQAFALFSPTAPYWIGATVALLLIAMAVKIRLRPENADNPDL